MLDAASGDGASQAQGVSTSWERAGWKATTRGDSSAMRSHLLVVSRSQAQLFGLLAEAFRTDESIQVLLDRRFSDRRRQTTVGHVPERRRADSRKQREADRRLEARGYVLVCSEEHTET